MTRVERTRVEEWFARISAVNRRQLEEPRARIPERGRGQSLRRRLKEVLRRRLGHSTPEHEHDWTVALNALGAEAAHRWRNDAASLDALRRFYDRCIDADGAWITPVRTIAHCAKGYALAYLAAATGEARYDRALDGLAGFLLREHPKVAEGTLPWLPHGEELLVDTLGLACPLLARYARRTGRAEARDLAKRQLAAFVTANVDDDTHLPYHGYYSDGPRRLGLHGWGRGTGWYLVGLADALLELDRDDEGFASLLGAYRSAADCLRGLQRSDGHWAWAVLHRGADLDSSATSLIGYALLRGVRGGLLDDTILTTVDGAIAALISATRSDGLVDHSSAECRGLGRYPREYGPRPWLQGSATALGALYLAG